MRFAVAWLFFLGFVNVFAVEWSKTTEVPSFQILRSARALEKPLFFAEIQNYRLVENYLHFWLDRPLFHDSSLRGNGSYEQSFIRNAELAKGYELDGFTMLGNAKSLARDYAMHFKQLENPMVAPGLRYLAGAAYVANPTAEWEEDFIKSYRLAADSARSIRIDGKIPVWGYHSQFFTLAGFTRLKAMIQAEKLAPPAFFSAITDSRFREIYERKGSLDEAELALVRQQLVELLQVVDGVIVSPIQLKRELNGEYAGVPQVDPYYRNVLLPVLCDLLSRPEFHKKMVGAYIYKGYVNHISGNVSGEYGTTNFRRVMDELLLLNPDFVVFFEWNEANENTHYQPTVYQGNAIKRLSRYYMRRMRGEAPMMEPGDDSSLPNLIFSSRQQLRLGDTIYYELLNIPDGSQKETYRAELTIKDHDGSILARFPAEIFDPNELKSVTFSLPTAPLSPEFILRPVLVIESAGKKQEIELQYNRLDPSVCVNYKEVYQPLRERYVPEKFHFEAKTLADGRTGFSADISGKEALRSLEILANEEEIAAAGEEFQDERLTIRGSITAFMATKRTVSFDVAGVSQWNWRRDHYRTALDEPLRFENRKFSLEYPVSAYYPQHFFWEITPAENAALQIELAGEEPLILPLVQLRKLGRFSRSFGADGMRIDLEVVENLADIPAPLRRNEASIESTRRLKRPVSVASLRAVTMDGKIFRSPPLITGELSGQTPVATVFCAGSGKGVQVAIPGELLRVLDYRFTPEYGDLLMPWDHRDFAGQLGGGFLYLEPFNRPRPLLLSQSGIKRLAPEWIEEDGRWLLRFDGIANYINFPREALPYGAFTLEMELRPTGKNDEVLFRNYSYHRGGVNLYRKDGCLYLIFTPREARPGFSRAEHFPTGLKVPEGEWSNIVVDYDLHRFRLTVNGESVEIAYDKLGVFFKPSCFGGHNYPESETPGKMKFFQGDLRKLKIYHGGKK